MQKRALVTVSHVSAVLGVSCRAVRRMLAAGELAGVKLGGRWYVPRGVLAQRLGVEV